MRLGVVFPQTEIGADPGAVRAFAQAAEELGYDHLLAYDHVLGADTTNRAGLARPVHAPSTSSTRSSSSSATSPRSRPGSSSSTGVLVLPAAADRARRQAGRRDRPAHRRALPARRRARLELRRVRGARRGLRESRPALGGADRGAAPALDGAGRRLRGPLAHASRRPGSTRSRCSGRSRSGSAAPPRRRSGAPRGLRTASSRSGRSRAAGRRRWSASAAGIEEAGRDPAEIGLEWRINVAEGTPDDWRREAEEWRAARRDAPLAWRRCAAASTSTGTSPASGEAFAALA